MPKAESKVLVNVSPQVMYEVITDFEAYPDFLPDVKNVEVIKKGKQLLAVFHLSLIKKFKYTLSFQNTKNKKVEWIFVEGDFFKDNRGAWVLKEIKKGVTEAVYSIDVDFGFLVPSLITKKLVGSNLPSMMKRFKERAESL